MNQTTCHSYFLICSKGEIRDQIGFVADAGSDFDPNYITEKLGIEPFETVKMNEPRRRANGTYPFSEWVGCRQDEPALDAEEQCLNIVRQMRPLLPQLREIKEEYNVDFLIVIVPHIYNAENPLLSFNSEIIDFCYHSGTEISVDLYIYDKE